MQTQTQDRLYFIRHGQSFYNVAQMVAKNTEHEVKTGDDLGVKFDYKLIDCSISDLGKTQCAEAAEKVKNINVKFVISSPLRRCLETTRRIFKDHPNKPKIVVWPVVKEMLLSSCDVPDDLATIKREYPDCDFSMVDALPHPELWVIHMLKNETLVNEILTELFEKYPSKEEAYKNAKFFLTDKLKQSYPALLETWIDINQRILEAREKLKPFVQEVKDGEAIIVVTHSRFLESISAESYKEDGEPHNAKWFVNCEVAPFDLLNN